MMAKDPRSLTHYLILQHVKQIDPTDIVLIPYDLSRLLLYVGLIIGYLIASSCLRGNSIPYHLLPSSAIALAMMILAGASPTKHILHSALSALYCAALCLSDPPIVVSVPPPNAFSEHVRYRLRGVAMHAVSDQKQREQAVVARGASQGAIAGAVVFQILRLYDRGWQVQRWPVPVIMGSTIGWTMGAFVGTLWVILGPPSRLEQKISEKD